MIYLAPLQGLTGLPFRKAFFKTFGNTIDIAISPFISLTHGDLSNNYKKLKDVLPESNQNSLRVIPQILGKEPELFIQLADTLYQLGYEEINWNLGCPVSRVMRKKRGSGLLPYPEEIEKILETVLSRISNKLSIKMRLGLSNPNEIFNLIPILNAFPLASVCIHPRIGTQMYEGELHLDTLETCLPLLKHPVIFNGDICTLEDFNAVKERFPNISQIMIGRGILKNPLLPDLLKEIRYPNPMQKLQEFEQNLFEEILSMPSPERNKLNKMKEYWYYFSYSFPDQEEALKKIVSVQTPTEYKVAAERMFDESFCL